MLVGILLVAMLYQGLPTYYSSSMGMVLGGNGVPAPGNNGDVLSTWVTVQIATSQTMPSSFAAASPNLRVSSENAIAVPGLWGNSYFFDQIRSRRGKLELYIEITKRLAGGPVTITELGVGANLNFSSTRDILGLLLENGLVASTVKDGRAKRYGLTERGYEFVRRSEEILRMVNGSQPSRARYLIPNR
ncbi:MAG: hypothetical protein JRN06_12835 [Nitrososphaerota archaeon]|nr:hypothetical protein [Nitrososphaerota archaeon]